MILERFPYPLPPSSLHLPAEGFVFPFAPRSGFILFTYVKNPLNEVLTTNVVLKQKDLLPHRETLSKFPNGTYNLFALSLEVLKRETREALYVYDMKTEEEYYKRYEKITELPLNRYIRIPAVRYTNVIRGGHVAMNPTSLYTNNVTENFLYHPHKQSVVVLTVHNITKEYFEVSYLYYNVPKFKVPIEYKKYLRIHGNHIYLFYSYFNLTN